MNLIINLFTLIWLPIIICKHSKPFYFEQKLDSFNLDDKRTFQQKYYINSFYYNSKSNNTLAILYLNGESSLKGSRVEGGLMLDLLDLYNKSSLLFALEHRFYGESQPFLNLTNTNLKYLTSEYAVEDILNFKKAMSLKYNIKDWILVGGSYSANLAIWSKAKHPYEYKGIVASSAPLNLKRNFHEYDEMVYEALGEECSKPLIKIRENWDQLIESNQLEELKRIKELFQCSKVENDILFFYTINDMIATIVQYNDLSGDTLSIKEFCQPFLSINQEEFTIEELTHLLKDQLERFLNLQQQTCYQFTNLDSLEQISTNKNVNFRSWTYQTCNEFGYWQTANPDLTKSIRSKYLTANWFQTFYCSPPYFSPLIQPNLTLSKKSYFQLDNINRSLNNSIISNGELDPWSKLSLLPNKKFSHLIHGNQIQYENNGNRVILIKDASHVNDLDTILDQDSFSLAQAKSFTINQILNWLN